MKFTALLVVLCSLVFIGSAPATPLSCAAVPVVDQCSPIQKFFGACPKLPADEVVCRTDRKSLTGAARSSKTAFGYYSPPDGYALEPETARAVFDGRGTHGVDASISKDRQLYCLWGTAGGYINGYCEVRARLDKSGG
jgi:hypothetical protein